MIYLLKREIAELKPRVFNFSYTFGYCKWWRMKEIVHSSVILKKIYFIRGHKVMLDRDLAELYEVETAQLKRQVRRNPDRLPGDFMFELSADELENLICQIGTSSWGGTRYMPMAFTEQGVAMLSSVLSSGRAIKVNIQIMRAFTQLRQMILSHDDLRRKIEAIEEKYDRQFRIVFVAIKELLRIESNPKKRIGFRVKDH
jgi:hypothetical protein